MPSRRDYVIPLKEDPAVAYESFTRRKYWEDLVKVHDENALTELTHFSSGNEGTDITFTHTMSRHHLPSVVAAVAPIEIVISREQHFDPFHPQSTSATGRFMVRVRGAPVDLGGTYLLYKTEEGGEMRLSSVCKVSLPLIGRKIEELLTNGIPHLLEAESRFTRDWIANHL